MKRLTKKDIKKALSTTTFFGERVVGKTMFYTMAKELIGYKDIEDKLGIDLAILIKALKDGAYSKDYPELREPRRIDLLCDDKKEWWVKWFLHCDWWVYYRLNDYGKTWALTKEELEDESNID